MGFDVTAANIIFFIAAVTVASVALGAYWTNASYVEEAKRTEDERAQQRIQTNLTITTATYDAGATRFTIDIKNMGSAVVDVSELTYFVDGTLVGPSSYESVSVPAYGGATDLLMPLETLEVKLLPISSSPSYFQVVTLDGAKANWRT